MTINNSYLFIYNQPSVWQTWKYSSKQQLPTNDATSLLYVVVTIFIITTPKHVSSFVTIYIELPRSFLQNILAIANIFQLRKAITEGGARPWALDCVHACAGWAWPSWGGAPAARKAECLSQGELSWVQLCYHTSHQGDCPRPRKCRLRNISTSHRHLRLVTSKARPAPSILMRMETDTSKCCTP